MNLVVAGIIEDLWWRFFADGPQYDMTYLQELGALLVMVGAACLWLAIFGMFGAIVGYIFYQTRLWKIIVPLVVTCAIAALVF